MIPQQTRTNVHPLRVVIADDHVMVRDGLRRLLQDALSAVRDFLCGLSLRDRPMQVQGGREGPE